MNGRRATGGVAAVLTVLLTLTIVYSPPSQAEHKQLLVSSSPSGPFTDNLATPLFADAGPMVPTDRASSTFYVKNNSLQIARTTVSVVNRASSSEFEEALTFAVDLQGTTTGGAVPAPGSDGCSMIATGPSILPGELQAVDVSLAVADLKGQAGMGQEASFDFVVTLTQAGADGQIDVCGAQAEAEPEVRGVQEEDQCRHDVVVTAVGEPTCVPTVVDAGTSAGGTEPREPAAVAGLAGLLLSLGAGLVLWAHRRRRDAAASAGAPAVT